MRKAELIDYDGKPTLPDLFWELAGRWQSESKDVQRYPSPAISGVTGSIDHALRLGLDNIETTTGWALSDTMAAAAYGAATTNQPSYNSWSPAGRNRTA